MALLREDVGNRKDFLHEASGEYLSRFNEKLNEYLIHYKRNKTTMLNYILRQTLD